MGVSNNREKTLLERALETPARRSRVVFGDEEIELAVAYVEGRLEQQQCREPLNCTSPAVPARVMRILRMAVVSGRVRIVLAEDGA